MSFKWCKKIIKPCNLKFIGSIILSIGIGMMVAIIFPIWIWIVIVGTALIVIGYNIYN